MKIVVLSLTPYKEKDAIVDAISEEGDITFLARGILDPKSKNAALNNILTIADIELNEGNFKHPVLKASSTIENPMKVNNTYDYLTSLMLVGETTKSLLQDEEKVIMFPYLTSAIEALKKKDEPLLIVLMYLAKLFQNSGYEFETNRCVFCGTKANIATFSFRDGGFVCQDCLEMDTEMGLNKNQMLLLRFAFNAKGFEEDYPYFTKDDAMVILQKFFEFISDSYGIVLKSSKLIK